jgi:hypothetical protein
VPVGREQRQQPQRSQRAVGEARRYPPPLHQRVGQVHGVGDRKDHDSGQRQSQQPQRDGRRRGDRVARDVDRAELDEHVTALHRDKVGHHDAADAEEQRPRPAQQRPQPHTGEGESGRLDSQHDGRGHRVQRQQHAQGDDAGGGDLRDRVEPGQGRVAVHGERHQDAHRRAPPPSFMITNDPTSSC